MTGSLTLIFLYVSLSLFGYIHSSNTIFVLPRMPNQSKVLDVTISLSASEDLKFLNIVEDQNRIKEYQLSEQLDKIYRTGNN